MKLTKKQMLLAAAIGCVAVYFLFIRKKGQTPDGTRELTEEEKLQAAQTKAAQRIAGTSTEMVEVQRTDGETEEYNLLRSEYSALTGGIEAKRSWTTAVLEAEIAKLKEHKSMLDKYVEITGDDDLTEEAEMTTAELETAILKYQRNKKDKWTARKAQLDGYVSKTSAFFGANRNKSKLSNLDGVTAISSDAEKRYFLNAYGCTKYTVYKSLTKKASSSDFSESCKLYIGGLKSSQKNTRARLEGLISKFKNVPTGSINEYGEFEKK